MFTVGLAVNVLLCIAVPLVLMRVARARYPLQVTPFAVGAAAFVGSQVVHIPLNAWLLPRLPSALPVVATFLGLSAGLFEETARYLAMRWRRQERSGPHALAFGIGHGGIESIFMGLLAASTLFNVLLVERIGITQLGLNPSTERTLTAQLAELHGMGGLLPLWGALERGLVIPAHIALSCLVMRSVVEKKVRFWALAVVLHALLDGVCVAVGRLVSPIMVEVFLAFTVPGSFAVIALSLRALPSHEPPPKEPRPEASEAFPISLVHAHKAYGAVQAVDDISFTLAQGERAALLGPNGAGKTTTIRMITGALAPTRGFVFLFGKPSDDESFLETKRRVGIVPQQPGMYAEMTVRSYLDFVRELYAPEDPDDAIASKLGLESVLDRPTNTLSGGMQRRLALAAALLSRPELLVLDEPSAGLDPVAARQMIACVKEASIGRTTLLCTHNLAEAEELCDSVIILRQGKVVLHTRLDELRKRTQTRVALRTQESPPVLMEALVARGHTPSIIEGEVCFPMSDAEHEVPNLLRDLLRQGLQVFECRIVRPSLEELFFQVLGAAPTLGDASAAGDSKTPEAS